MFQAHLVKTLGPERKIYKDLKHISHLGEQYGLEIPEYLARAWSMESPAPLEEAWLVYGERLVLVVSARLSSATHW